MKIIYIIYIGDYHIIDLLPFRSLNTTRLRSTLQHTTEKDPFYTRYWACRWGARLVCHCGGWNEKHPHRFTWPNTWSPAGGAVEAGYGTLAGKALLEEACQKGQPLRFHSLAPPPALLCCLCVDDMWPPDFVTAQLVSCDHHRAIPSGSWANNAFLF